MKIWMIAAVLGMLAIAGFAVVNALETTEVADNLDNSGYVGAGSCGEPSCNGGCSAGNSCGSPSCGATTGGSCGCRG